MEKSKFILYALLLVIAVWAIYFFSRKAERNGKQKTPPRIDTSFSSQRPSITADSDTIPPVAEKIAPGTALVQAQVVSVDYEDEIPARITLKVNKVLGYGPATPPIAPESRLSIHVLGFVKANNQYKDTFKKGTNIQAVLVHQKGLKLQGSDSGDSWTIGDIKQ